MATPNYNFQLVAAAVAGSIAQGSCAVQQSSGTDYVTSTLASRGSRRSSGIAVGPAPSGGNRLFVMQTMGDIPASVSGLGAGAAGPVRVNDSGLLERRPTPANGDDIVGWAEATGLVHCAFGVLPWDHFSAATLNGASVPAAGALTTGNVLQVSGPSALAYAPVNLAGGANYVTGALPVGNGGTGLSALPGSNGQLLYNNSSGGPPGSFSATGNFTYNGGLVGNDSAFVSLSSAPAAAGWIRFPSIASPQTYLAIRNNAGSGDYNLIIGSGSSVSFGDSAYNLNLVGASVSCNSASFNINTGAQAFYVTTGLVGCSQPVGGDQRVPMPFRWKSAAIVQNSTADNTLSAATYENVVIVISGTPGGNFNIILPDTQNAFFVIVNTTANTATCKKTAGAGVAIATGKTAMIRHNGTDYVRVTPDA